MDDSREALGYFLALTDRRDLLESFLIKSETLPTTLNHCDLHTDNVSETEDGSMLIYDWDDAMMGPAGMSLYRLISGCSQVIKLLDTDINIEEDQEHHRKIIRHYVNKLVDGGYSDKKTIIEALPAAVCAGTIQSLIQYNKFPQDDYDYKKNISEIIRNRIEDLVHLCDLLALQNRKDVFFYAENYQKNNAPWRGIYLLDQYSLLHPNDVEVLRSLAYMQMDFASWECATNTLQKALAITPDDAEMRKNLGISFVKNAQPELAIKELEIALQINPSIPQAAEYIDKASQLIYWTDRAKVPHLAPTIELSNEEMEGDAISAEKGYD